ncbi:hypothetical protein GW932_01590 [archaeon]|nr:hypothetical protein [archaeon]
MFNKKICNNCSEKIKGNPNFCPNCGIQLKDLGKDWGMLGKKDKQNTNQQINFGGGLTGNLMNKLVTKMMKDLTKGSNDINGKDIEDVMKTLLPGVKVVVKKTPANLRQNEIDKKTKDNTKILPIEFEEETLTKWKKLKKEEPKSNLKRVGDKIQYELEIPGVESIKDISIVKLENSIEVKAVSDEKAYSKTISLNLPLKKYSLLKGILTLELDASM